MKTGSGKRLIRTYTMQLPFLAKEIFPLLCPVREYDWIPEWHCRLAYTESGFAELGCVFQTEFADQFGLETWVVSKYEKDSCIAFVRTGEHRTTRYTITLTPVNQSTSLVWQQELTGLSDRGNDLLTSAPPAAFSTQMQKLEQLLNNYLTNQ